MTSRRKFIKASIAGAAALSVNKAFADSDFLNDDKSIDFSKSYRLKQSDHFPLGIMSGDVTTDNIILWSQYSGFFKLALCIWEQSKNNTLELNQVLEVSRGENGYILAPVQGLRASRKYRYCLVEINFENKLEKRSLLGHFRTPPKDNEEEIITFGALSCIKNIYGADLLEHAARRNDLSAFLFLGDTSYNDKANSLKELRGLWDLQYGKRGFRALHAKTSVIAAIDDHELTDNFNPETINRLHYKNALKAYFEHSPMKRNAKNKRQIWRSHRFGKTVEVFTLDCRTERRPSTRGSRDEQYISPEQMQFLKDGLKNSECKFKIIMNTVPITEFPFPLTRDRWQGYKHQRQEILSFIDSNKIEGLLWVAGDFHFGCISRVSKYGAGSTQKEVLAGPAAQFPNYLGSTLKLSSRFDFVTTRNNYVTLRCDPKKNNIKVEFHTGSHDPHKNSIREVRTRHTQNIRF